MTIIVFSAFGFKIEEKQTIWLQTFVLLIDSQISDRISLTNPKPLCVYEIEIFESRKKESQQKKKEVTRKVKIDLEKEYTIMATTEDNAVDDMKHCYENLILIDVGANLTNKKYSRDLDAVVQRAQDSGTHFVF